VRASGGAVQRPTAEWCLFTESSKPGDEQPRLDIDSGGHDPDRRPTMTLAASNYPFLDLMWTFFLFFGLILFFWLLFTVFGDLFRRRDIGGWGKAGWSVFVILLPMIGTFTYLITQGRKMGDRNVREAEQLQHETDEYIRSVAGNGHSRVDEIARGKQLLDNGAISADEFEEIKRHALV
jgi:hypothetical protein